MTHDKLMQELAREVAREMPIVYAEKGRAKVSEMYVLQPATNRVLQRLAPTWVPAPTLGSKKFGTMHGWVGLGHVDAVLRWPAGARTFLELKCGSDASACIWDAVKLATGVLGENADSGYMLAGASSTSWRKPVPGTELFTSNEWETAGPAIRDAYRSWWLYWQKEGHIPDRVPRKFRTVALGSFAFEIRDEAWGLRLARVEPVGGDWLQWQPIAPK